MGRVRVAQCSDGAQCDLGEIAGTLFRENQRQLGNHHRQHLDQRVDQCARIVAVARFRQAPGAMYQRGETRRAACALEPGLRALVHRAPFLRAAALSDCRKTQFRIEPGAKLRPRLDQQEIAQCAPWNQGRRMSVGQSFQGGQTRERRIFGTLFGTVADQRLQLRDKRCMRAAVPGFGVGQRGAHLRKHGCHVTGKRVLECRSGAGQLI